MGAGSQEQREGGLGLFESVLAKEDFLHRICEARKGKCVGCPADRYCNYSNSDEQQRERIDRLERKVEQLEKQLKAIAIAPVLEG